MSLFSSHCFSPPDLPAIRNANVDQVSIRCRSGADQSFVDDSLAGDGVLAPERLPEPVVAVELGGDGEQTLDGRDVRFALGHRIKTAGIGEGVEIEGAVVAVAPDLAEQLKRSA